MLLMHNETGELYELLICSLDSQIPENTDNIKKWRVGEVALFGTIDPGIRSNNEIALNMTLVGFV